MAVVKQWHVVGQAAKGAGAGADSSGGRSSCNGKSPWLHSLAPALSCSTLTLQAQLASVVYPFCAAAVSRRRRRIAPPWCIRPHAHTSSAGLPGGGEGHWRGEGRGSSGRRHRRKRRRGRGGGCHRHEQTGRPGSGRRGTNTKTSYL